ncbi:MAG TPA: AI-2E family transporter [Candidatus Nitrosotalea sp.]|nr:AI-2E family transporter [Candidatus Nitrosotalea sp.]
MRGTRRNPWRWLTESRVTYALKILMVLVLAFYAGAFIVEILARIRGVVYIVIAAVFFAYIIYPAVQRLRRFMPLVLAIVLVYAGILVALVLFAFFIVPHVMDDVQMLVRRYPELVAGYRSLLYDPKDTFAAHLPAWVRDEAARMPMQTVEWIKTRGLFAFSHIVVVLAGTAAILALFIVVPVVTAYLLLDLDHLKAMLASVVPAERWRATMELLAEIDAVIGGFVRGQLIVAFTVGVLITVAMMLLRVPYPYLWGLLAIFGDLVPYVGAVLAFIPACVSAVVANGWINGLLVALAFVVIYEVEGHFIAPNVVGKQVKLSAFVVVVALLIGAELAGLFGMLIAVPLAGMLRVVTTRVIEAAKSKAPPS